MLAYQVNFSMIDANTGSFQTVHVLKYLVRFFFTGM